MRQYGIFEVLQFAQQAVTEAEKIDVLRRNDSHPLRMVLQYALDKRVSWLLPPGLDVPYTPSKQLDSENALKTACQKLYLFVALPEGPLHKTLKARKREELFIQVLESVHPRDAILLIYAKEKKLPDTYSTITPELIDKAFPNMYLVYDPTPTTSER